MVTASTAQSKHYRFGDDPAALVALANRAMDAGAPVAVKRVVDDAAGRTVAITHYNAFVSTITGERLSLRYPDGGVVKIPRWQVGAAAIIDVIWEEC